MNAGKSTTLLQSSYNYNERGMDTVLFTPAIAARDGKKRIASRIGLAANAIAFERDFNFFPFVLSEMKKNPRMKCVLIDEAQFLTKQQVYQLGDITDELGIPVLCYGLRTDFRGEPFEGSQYLLAWSDNLVEIKTICHCGRKAIMNPRIDSTGRMVSSGNQIEIGGNDRYISTCRKHFKKSDMGAFVDVAGMCENSIED